MSIKRLIIMQGCSGSGKTFVAESLILHYRDKDISYKYCSADNFFIQRGQYNFDPSRLVAAHSFCKQQAQDAMNKGVDVVIIDNTNTTQKEANFYIHQAKEYNYNISVISVSSDDDLVELQNSSRTEDRQVPQITIDRQKSRMQKLYIE